jgi:hypothetical protein
MLEDGGDLGLPRGVVVNGDYEMQAALLAVDAAIDRSKVDLIGVAQFHHTLDVTNQDADSHNAQICITYVFSVAAADVDVEALAWAPPTDARWGSDAAVVLEKIVAGAVYPANIVTTMEGDAAPANFGADSVRLREQLGAVLSAAASARLSYKHKGSAGSSFLEAKLTPVLL